MNYYELLEVNPKASAEVIRAAYKSLMQRYHPDKNPGDQAIAERAALVVQAYEVLSNTAQRAQYDVQLSMLADRQLANSGASSNTGKAQVAAREKGAKQKENNSFWALCLLILAIIVAAWALTALLNHRLPQEPVASDAMAKFSPPPPTAAAGPVQEIPVLITGLSVPLKNPESPEESTGRVLNIPSIGVRVGAQDPENAIRHLNNTKEAIAQKLKEKLATAKVDELAKASGTKYLTDLILGVISESAGTQFPANQASDSAVANRYGAVAVLLPESFPLGNRHYSPIGESEEAAAVT